MRHYQVWYDGKLASVHVTRNGAKVRIAEQVLKGWTGKFELKEGCTHD